MGKAMIFNRVWSERKALQQALIAEREPVVEFAKFPVKSARHAR